jgi:putative ABC transport system permease protein
MFSELASDLKFAARSLRKSRVMTLTAVIALALGIGANTALFSVVDAVLLRSLDYPDADRIVQLTRSWPGDVNGEVTTPTKFEFWRTENQSFGAVAAYNFQPIGMNLTDRGEAQRLMSLPVSADFFRVLGVGPLVGRTFTEAEDNPAAGRFAVISYSLWQQLFGGDPAAIGKALRLDTADYTVLGVMPAGFAFHRKSDLWTPLQLRFDASDHANDYGIIARLKPGVSLAQAAQDMRMVARRFRQHYGTDPIVMEPREFVGVHSLHSWLVGDVRPALLVLMGAVGFVLLIVCANVANLLLTRSAMRQNEMAVRTALGASGLQLVRLLLTESLLLSAAGGALGVLLAQFSAPLIVSMAPADLPQTAQIGADWSVLSFAAVVSVATGLLFGLVPAVQFLRSGLNNRLRSAGGRNATQGSARLFRKVLVVAEVATSLVLLIGAGLLIQTFKSLNNVNPGFDIHNVLTMQMSLTADRFRATDATASLDENVRQRIEAIPGVLAAGTISNLPTQRGFDLPFEIIGRRSSKDIIDAALRVVTPDYFEAMRIPLVTGRTFKPEDTRRSRPVILVNAAFAHKYFPHETAVGQQLLIGRVMGPVFADVPREIVGVIGDTHDAGLDAPPDPTFFEPAAQLPDSLTALGNQLVPDNWVIRTAGNPMLLASRIRRETLIASGGVPMADPRLLEQVIGSSIARQRFSMTLLSLFAGLAVLLCAIGLYGVISYSAAQRTRELSIRAALGAGQRDLLKLVVGQGMWLVGLGLIIGLLAAGGLTRFLQGMLFGVTAFDPRVLATVTAALGAIALAACWAPARRAASVDAALVLREE